MRKALTAIMLVALATAGALVASPAKAIEHRGEAGLARTLDDLDLTFARHNREHRMMEIQRNLDRQNRGRGYGYGYGRGRGYDRGYGYNRGYGYRRDYGGGYGRGYGGGNPNRGSSF